MSLKIGDKVECGFDKMSDEARREMEIRVETVSKGRAKYSGRHLKTEPDHGVIESIKMFAPTEQNPEGKVYQVRMTNQKTGEPGRLREYSEKYLKAE